MCFSPVVAVAAPPPPPAAPPQPQAPAFPYQLIGRLDDGPQTQALLAGAQRTLAAKAGDLLDGQWRVDRVEADAVHLTWLPGKLPQTIGYLPRRLTQDPA